MRHEVIVPLPMLNSCDYRVMGFGAPTGATYPADRLLLAMVRPHLVAIRDAVTRTRRR